MANTLKTPQELIEQAKANARAAKKLQQSVTVASGAVIGGPATTPPPVAPTAPGATGPNTGGGGSQQ